MYRQRLPPMTCDYQTLPFRKFEAPPRLGVGVADTTKHDQTRPKITFFDFFEGVIQTGSAFWVVAPNHGTIWNYLEHFLGEKKFLNANRSHKTRQMTQKEKVRHGFQLGRPGCRDELLDFRVSGFQVSGVRWGLRSKMVQTSPVGGLR